MKVISLHIYPIKGMQPISVESARVLERGLEHDRRYMLIDKNGSFISQRTHAELVFFKPELIDNELVVSHKNESISIPLETSLNNTIETTICQLCRWIPLSYFRDRKRKKSQFET